MSEEQIEVFKIQSVGLREGANLDRNIGVPWRIMADRYSPSGVFVGRLLVTETKPRELLHSSREGFVTSRCFYDF